MLKAAFFFALILSPIAIASNSHPITKIFITPLSPENEQLLHDMKTPAVDCDETLLPPEAVEGDYARCPART